jgi:glucokinase-like ROK family protein
MTINQYIEGNQAGSQPKKGGQDLQYLRANNLWVLLSAIRENGPISRFDLAHLTGLAPSSVTRMVQVLVQLGLIVEIGKGKSSGGRQPILIATNPAAGLVISLDLSGPHIRGGVFDAANHLIKAVDQPFNGLGPTAIQSQMFSMIRDLLKEPLAQDHHLLGIGVSLPGAVDMETGDVQTSYNLRLQNFPLRRVLMAEFGLPVYIEHDASVAALAEQYYGAGRGKNYMIYILVSTGIGSGIIFNGQVFRGETGKSGEFGHIIVDSNGQLCVCGKRGCLEALAAAPAMLSSARWMVMHGRAEALSHLCGDDPEKLTIDILAQAARAEDPVACDILARSADYLAQGLTIYASIIDIQWMVVGGEVAETGDVFFNPLNRAMEKYRRNGLDIKIIPAELKQDTFLQGVSMLTLQEVLRSQVLQLR